MRAVEIIAGLPGYSKARDMAEENGLKLEQWVYIGREACDLDKLRGLRIASSSVKAIFLEEGVSVDRVVELIGRDGGPGSIKEVKEQIKTVLDSREDYLFACRWDGGELITASMKPVDLAYCIIRILETDKKLRGVVKAWLAENIIKDWSAEDK